MEIQDVEKLAALARISLSDEEKQSLLHDMQGILEYVKQVEGVEIADMVPEYPLRNAWREDALDDKKFSRESIVAQFPDSQGGFLKTKKILNND